MPLYEFERRLTPIPVLRFLRWWEIVLASAKNTTMELHATHLAQSNHTWVCSDDSYLEALKFFSAQPGWQGLDNHGTPLTFRRLSPREEHEALQHASPELRQHLAPECICPPTAPRQVRREAERAWQKWVERRMRERERSEQRQETP